MNRVTARLTGGWDFHADVQKKHVVGAQTPLLFVGPASTYTFKAQTNPPLSVTLLESFASRVGLGRRILPSFRFVGETWSDNS